MMGFIWQMAMRMELLLSGHLSLLSKITSK